MKVLGLIAAAHAISLSGIVKDDLMQNQPSHWRKAWPEGNTDNGDEDALVIDMFLEKEKKKPKPVITYPWSLDEDAVSTSKSIEWAEKKTSKKLTAAGAAKVGMDMIDLYDNTKRVFERDTPQGNTWHDFANQHN